MSPNVTNMNQATTPMNVATLRLSGNDEALDAVVTKLEIGDLDSGQGW